MTVLTSGYIYKIYDYNENDNVLSFYLDLLIIDVNFN
jgi:hypothetical protein